MKRIALLAVVFIALAVAPVASTALAAPRGHGGGGHGGAHWARPSGGHGGGGHGGKYWGGHDGRWHHGWHNGRFGRWWVVGDSWLWYPFAALGYALTLPFTYPYTYSYPAYSYPEPYYPLAGAQAAPELPLQPQESVWYYCANPAGYYPYVPECRSGWRAVPSSPPRGPGPSAPAPAAPY
jgi:hypothetical protein